MDFRLIAQCAGLVEELALKGSRQVLLGDPMVLVGMALGRLVKGGGHDLGLDRAFHG